MKRERKPSLSGFERPSLLREKSTSSEKTSGRASPKMASYMASPSSREGRMRRPCGVMIKCVDTEVNSVFGGDNGCFRDL